MKQACSEVAIVTTAWGDYWSRFGGRWVAAVQALEHAPAEVIVASDERLALPDGWVCIPARKPYFLDAWFGAIQRASSPWIFMCGLDDEPTPNAMTDLVLEGDVIYGPQITDDGTAHGPNPSGWETILNFDGGWFPCTGWNLMRRDVYLQYPQRRAVWADWMMACELRYHNVDVRFQDTVRQIYHLHPDQHSRSDKGQSRKRIEEFKRMLATGRVVPGLDWPPVLS